MFVKIIQVLDEEEKLEVMQLYTLRVFFNRKDVETAIEEQYLKFRGQEFAWLWDLEPDSEA